MKTLFKTTVHVLLMLTLSCGLVFSQAASRAAATTNAVSFSVTSSREGFTGEFFDAIKTTIKPPAGQSDLLVTFSAATLLTASSTNTSVVVGSVTDERMRIDVRLLVDGKPVPFAFPEINVVLDDLVKETDLTIVPATVTEVLTQVLQQGGVRSLTWAVPSVGNGEHTVTVQARFVFSNRARLPGTGQLSLITEILGPRTLIVEAVNIKNF